MAHDRKARASDRALGAGAFTFLLSDIEGSTRLLREAGDSYPALLADHRRLLRAAFGDHGGTEVDTQGDSFFVAFPTPRQAFAAAADGQRVLAAHPWSDGRRVLVRMGLHTGEASPVGDGYIGLAVNRAARIAALGHGGQVLVSEATAALVGEELPPGTALRYLGDYRLKDFPRPTPPYQLDVAGLPTGFPELPTLSRSSSLPMLPGALLGRDTDVATVAACSAGRRPAWSRSADRAAWARPGSPSLRLVRRRRSFPAEASSCRWGPSRIPASF